MKEFRSFADLKKFLNESIEKAIKGKVVKKVKNIMRKQIIKDVYRVYNPTMYKRRGTQGGLLANENIVSNNRGKKAVEIFNIAERNRDYSDTVYTNKYLTPLIELGHLQAKGSSIAGNQGYNYPYKYLAYYQPRPFMRNTRNELIRSKEHIPVFMNDLKSLFK
jgi:hypothetical protein